MQKNAGIQTKLSEVDIIWQHREIRVETMDDFVKEIRGFLPQEDYIVLGTDGFGRSDTREKLRRFVNAGSIREIVFTRGTTEAINLVANTFGRSHLRTGDEIIVSEIEEGGDGVWHIHGVGIESGEDALSVLATGAVVAYEPGIQVGPDAFVFMDGTAPLRDFRASPNAAGTTA